MRNLGMWRWAPQAKVPSVGAHEGKRMRSRIELSLTIAAGVAVFVTLAWTIKEVGKSNRAIAGGSTPSTQGLIVLGQQPLVTSTATCESL
jgi:hypothetical protein